MCGRYTVLTEDEIIEIREIIQNLSLRIIRDDFENYDEKPGEICPSDHAPVITRNDEGIAFESAKWGFKKWDSPGVIINARSETIKQKSTFAKHLETGRCVVPAGEFFEWEKHNKKSSDSSMKKHYAKDREGNLLFLAGLYRDNKDEKIPGKMIREFVIITKEATGEMAKIHDRMPVILRVDQLEAWLTGEMTPEDLEKREYDIKVEKCNDEEADSRQISLF